jgi:hypothetical protein
MRLSQLAFIVGIAALPATAAEQTTPDTRAELTQLYTLSVAIDTCDGIDISSDDEDRLDKAISAAEAKLALTEEASSALYDQLSAAADSDKDGFCKDVMPKLKPMIDKLPP